MSIHDRSLVDFQLNYIVVNDNETCLIEIEFLPVYFAITHIYLSTFARFEDHQFQEVVPGQMVVNTGTPLLLAPLTEPSFHSGATAPVGIVGGVSKGLP